MSLTLEPMVVGPISLDLICDVTNLVKYVPTQIHGMSSVFIKRFVFIISNCFSFLYVCVFIYMTSLNLKFFSSSK